ncbi:hypothetical protein GH714_040907 [Hevea brasiliensis]|uniref:DExH14 plug domain-containing protein n=1 Tax=Hevea brasiliensis TaxID=3981 RepID=A0A6A6MHU3_HEVBR|nr:hypothetical protein GH714_040907 [Hevea brasiliensis]
MLMQLPRLTNSLRDPFDVDQAYLQRKIILQKHLKHSNTANSLNESELARKIVDRWEEASTEVRQAYKHFIGAVVDLIDREVPSEEFRVVALTAYHLFGGPGPGEEDNYHSNILKKKDCFVLLLDFIFFNRSELQKLTGHAVSDANIQRVATLAQRLSSLQPTSPESALVLESHVNGSGSDLEFGADLAFQTPARFLVDVTLEDEEGEETTGSSSLFQDGWQDHNDCGQNHSADDGGKFNLSWLRDACDQIVRESTSQLSQDDLAMAICRVLDSDKPGEEIASDLLDLVGDSAFETVQDLITYLTKGCVI